MNDQNFSYHPANVVRGPIIVLISYFMKITSRILTPVCQSPNCRFRPSKRSSGVYPLETEWIQLTALSIDNWSPTQSWLTNFFTPFPVVKGV